MKALDEILVLIPAGDERHPYVAVCSVGDLVRELESQDELEEAIEAASIDVSMTFTPEEVGRFLFKMHKSNAASTFTYWDTDRPQTSSIRAVPLTNN